MSLRHLKKFNAHTGDPGLGNAEGCCGPVGEVEFPPRDERPPVINPNYAAATGSQAGYPNQGPIREGAVSGGHAVHIVGLAVGGWTPMKTRAVPTGDTLPYFQRFDRQNWLCYGYRRRMDYGSDQEHEQEPARCRPSVKNTGPGLGVGPSHTVSIVTLWTHERNLIMVRWHLLNCLFY